MSTKRHQLASVAFFAWLLAQVLPQVTGFGWPILWSLLLGPTPYEDPSGAVRLIFPANAVLVALAYVPVVLAARELVAAAAKENAGRLARGASIALLVFAVTSLASRVVATVFYIVPGPGELVRVAGDLGTLGILVALVAVLAEARAARVPAFAALAAVAVGELELWALVSEGPATLVLALAAFVVSRGLLWLALRRARPIAPVGPSLRELPS